MLGHVVIHVVVIHVDLLLLQWQGLVGYQSSVSETLLEGLPHHMSEASPKGTINDEVDGGIENHQQLRGCSEGVNEITREYHLH